MFKSLHVYILIRIIGLCNLLLDIFFNFIFFWDLFRLLNMRIVEIAPLVPVLLTQDFTCVFVNLRFLLQLLRDFLVSIVLKLCLPVIVEFSHVVESLSGQLRLVH